MDDAAGRIKTAGRTSEAGEPSGAAGTTETASATTDADRDDADQRVVEIRQEIEITRGEITETIDAIQEKLKPRNILANATDRVKNATAERVNEMADTAGRTARHALDYSRQAANRAAGGARQNAVPLALVGIGAAWLLANRSRNTSYYGGSRGLWRDDRNAVGDYRDGVADESAAPSEPRYEDRAAESGFMAKLRNNPIPTALAGVGLSWLAFARSDRGEDESRWREPWREGYSDSDRQLASRAREYASETAESVRRMARRRTNQMERMVHENPLLVGAGALLLGAAFGLAVPETETENEWMGESRDAMMERARTAATDAVGEVQEAASTVVDVAKKVAGKTEA